MFLSSLPKYSFYKCSWTTPVTRLVNKTNSKRHITIRLNRHSVHTIILNKTLSQIFLQYKVTSIHVYIRNFFRPQVRVTSLSDSRTAAQIIYMTIEVMGPIELTLSNNSIFASYRKILTL